jgi:hypothetical protein
MRADYAYLALLLIAIVLIEFLPEQVLRGAHTAGLPLFTWSYDRERKRKE